MKRTFAAAFILLLVITTAAFAHRGGRQGGTCNGAGLDMTKKVTVDGTIVSFTGGPGVGEPTLTVKTAAGQKVFKPSPYRVVMTSGYEFKEGASVSIVAAPCSKDATELGIVSLKDVASGKELVFRNAEGLPTGGRGMRK